jgi:hypothetical protein
MTTSFLYIDPNSGSYIIQMIIAGILGSLFFFKNAWLRIKLFFTGKKTKEEIITKEELDNEL